MKKMTNINKIKGRKRHGEEEKKTPESLKQHYRIQ